MVQCLQWVSYFSSGEKMAGKKGRSGRKPRMDGYKSKAVALYIDHMEWEKESGKIEWVAISWFQQFKRIYGSRMQAKIRNLIKEQVYQDQRERMWKCECNGMMSYHFRHQHQCPKCEQWQNKTVQRVHGGC